MKAAVILLVLATSLSSMASVERVRYRAVVSGVAEPLSRVSLVQTLPNADGTALRYFYDVAQGELRVQAVEKFDVASGEIQAFRHRGMAGGQEYWSDWMPGSLRAKLQVSWPSADSIELARGEVKNTKTLAAVDGVRLAADIEMMQAAPSQEPEKSFSKKINWNKDATYTWAYNSAKHQLWAGYLWDWKNGMLWRGYREPTKSGKILTPSQNQKSTDPDTIAQFYRNSRVDISKYNERNTKDLSPLDKWGIWASRKEGQNWWTAAAWEAEHKGADWKWGGYCNASVASGILLEKPLHGFVDRGVQFDPRDIVGLVQIAMWKVDFLFYGSRCDKGCDDMEDPEPSFIIDLIDQYVGKQGMPLAADLEADDAVGNETIIDAKLTIGEGDRKGERYAELTVHSITNFDDEKIPEGTEGTSPDINPDSISTNVYGFKVYPNLDGSIKSMRWDDKRYHPDFLWMPTAFGDYPESDEKNPNLKMANVLELLSKSRN